MTTPNEPEDYAAELRAEAEKRAAERLAGRLSPSRDDEALWELQVHQEELELQKAGLEEVQAELQRSRDRYRDLYERAPVGYADLDEAAVILEVNHRAAELIGEPAKHLAGQRLTAFVSAADADRFQLAHRQALASGAEQSSEVTVKSTGGRETPVRLLLTGVRDEGSAPRCRTVLLDLSERRKAESRLKDSEQRFRSIAERIRDVFYVREPDGTLAYVSPAFEGIWGRPVSEVFGASPEVLYQTVVEVDRDRLRAAHAKASAGELTDETVRIVRPDGEERWIRDRAYPVDPQRDGRHRVVGVAQDITEQRKLEEELRQAQKMEAIGALASGVAHDFGNVLQAITGSATMAADESTPPEKARELMRRVGEAARRGKHMTRQLMLFNRKQAVDARPIAIDRVIEDSAHLLRRLLTEQIGVELSCRASNCLVLADPVQIEQVLMNLGANARDAMAYGGTLYVGSEEVTLDEEQIRWRGLTTPGRFVRLLVRDTGAGMDAETKEHIFEPFFTTKGVGRGTGLGMSTVFAVTKQLGGHIEIDSEPDQGTTFRILLPCFEGAVEEAGPEEGEASAHGMALVIEDEPLVRRTLAFYLDQLGYDVLQASSVEEAQELADSYQAKIDMVLADVYLPQSTGPKLVEELHERCGDFKTLYISGHAREVLEDRGVLSPGEKMLQKPFSQEELTAGLASLQQGDAVVSPDDQPAP